MQERKSVKIIENDYIVKFPTVGQIMDIEAMKFSLAKGKYVEMCLSPLKIHIYTLDTIDAIATFAVLIPELKKDLGVENWKDVNPLIAKKLLRAYKNDFITWYKPIIDDLCNYTEVEEKSDVDDGEEAE